MDVLRNNCDFDDSAFKYLYFLYFLGNQKCFEVGAELFTIFFKQNV